MAQAPVNSVRHAFRCMMMSFPTTKGTPVSLISAAGIQMSRAFQDGVDDWMDACFGEPIKSDSLERADRLTEEALELVQTVPGFTAERAHALVDYVFNRPVGERGQEVGGTMVCLAALCNTFGLSMDDEADRELSRIWTKVEQIRAKQAAKPTGSALPMKVSPDA